MYPTPRAYKTLKTVKSKETHGTGAGPGDPEDKNSMSRVFPKTSTSALGEGHLCINSNFKKNFQK